MNLSRLLLIAIASMLVSCATPDVGTVVVVPEVKPAPVPEQLKTFPWEAEFRMRLERFFGN